MLALAKFPLSKNNIRFAGQKIGQMCAKISLLAPPHTPDVCPLSSSHLRLKEPIKSFKGVNTCVKGVNTTALLA